MLGEYDAGYENYIDSLIREIEKLQDENDKLSEQVSSLIGRSFRTADKMSCIEAENAKLREQMERLVTLLRVDCNIDASWDGLRRFWSIELTEDGCLMRDRACKAEAEADRLREERDTYRDLVGYMVHPDIPDQLAADNAKLRELVKRMFDRVNYECRCCSVFCSDWDEDNECCVFTTLMRELGVEVDK